MVATGILYKEQAMTYKPTPTNRDGVRTEVTTNDEKVKQLLADILDQLKINNYYMKLLTGEEVEIRDIKIKDEF